MKLTEECLLKIIKNFKSHELVNKYINDVLNSKDNISEHLLFDVLDYYFENTDKYFQMYNWYNIDSNEEFFRSRMYDKEILNREKFDTPFECGKYEGFDEQGSGAPPSQYAKIGRFNDNNESILYLSKDLETTYYELNLMENNIVSVGLFKLDCKTKPNEFAIILKLIDNCMPYNSDNKIELYLNKILIAIKYLCQRRTDEHDYYNISDKDIYYICNNIGNHFKTKYNIDGIAYDSAKNPNPDCVNFAIFNSSKFKCCSSVLRKSEKDYNWKF